MRKISRILLAILCIFLFVEINSQAGLYYLEKYSGIHYEPLSKDNLSESDKSGIQKFWSAESPYFTPSPRLGWTIKRGGSSGKYQANAQGLRAQANYAEIPAEGKMRIAAFGDSFTHGDEVEFSETWEERLKKMDSRFEVLNFGVSAFGPDQAYLRYQEEGKYFHPQMVLIGYISEDLERMVSVFRPFYGGGTHFPLAKPRFILEENKLKLLENPLPKIEDYRRLLLDPGATLKKLGEKDYQYQNHYEKSPCDFFAFVRLLKIVSAIVKRRFSENRILDKKDIHYVNSEAFQITARVLKEFYREAARDGAKPLILLFPDKYDLEKFRKQGITRYAPLENYFRQEGLLYLDLTNAFEREAKNEPVSALCRAHYTPRGNEIVAKAVFQFLNENHFLEPAEGDQVK